MDDDSRILIEQSKQLVAAARELVEESRRIRANAQSSTHRAQRILALSSDAATKRAATKLAREPRT
jgi:hypothetical protein